MVYRIGYDRKMFTSGYVKEMKFIIAFSVTNELKARMNALKSRNKLRKYTFLATLLF